MDHRSERGSSWRVARPFTGAGHLFSCHHFTRRVGHWLNGLPYLLTLMVQLVLQVMVTPAASVSVKRLYMNGSLVPV